MTQELELSIDLNNRNFLEEHDFIQSILTIYSVDIKFCTKVYVSINESILYVNKNNSEKHIKIIAKKTEQQLEIVIRSRDKSLSIEPCIIPEITSKIALKDLDLDGRSLHLIKHLPDKTSFFDNGAEIRLFFYKPYTR